MLRKVIITLCILGFFYGLYLYGTRNSDVTLSESLEDSSVDLEASTSAGAGLRE